MLFKPKKPTFTISLAPGLLDHVYDECDRYDVDETGGRLIGVCKESRNHFDIQVQGILDAGPKATRSPVSFFQDGEYQEQAFRAIEAVHPEIEHLGSWHTHHVNGLQTLSGGDRTTYFATVNHAKHNTNFFYAMLVVAKNRHGSPRYTVKHFIFRRGDNTIYEIPHSEVLNGKAMALPARRATPPSSGANLERAKDQAFFEEFYPGLKPMLSKSSGSPYWRGALALIDGSHAEVVAMEASDGKSTSYSVATSHKDPVIDRVAENCARQEYPSARRAVREFENCLNRALYDHHATRGKQR